MYPGDERNERPGISAVLATHNRQTDLAGAVLDLAAVLDGLVFDNFEIIIVDQEAPDGQTSDVLAGLRARCPGFPARMLEERYADRAMAVAAGFDAARYDLVFVSAADGQFDVRELNHLLEAIEHGADLAVGYRARRADGLVRRFQGWGWNVLVNLLLGKTARDVDCAFKLIRRAVWQAVGMQTHAGGPTYCAELIIRARRQGFRVAEVPVSHRRSQNATRSAATPAQMGRAVVKLNELRQGLERENARLGPDSSAVRVSASRPAA